MLHDNRLLRHAHPCWALQARPRPPTLLQKLLAKDIRTEHSHLLQAFRFFVSNDFLVHASNQELTFPPEPAALPPEFDDPGKIQCCCSCAAGGVSSWLSLLCMQGQQRTSSRLLRRTRAGLGVKRRTRQMRELAGE